MRQSLWRIDTTDEVQEEDEEDGSSGRNTAYEKEGQGDADHGDYLFS